MAERSEQRRKGRHGAATRRSSAGFFASSGFLVFAIVLILGLAGWASLVVAPGPLNGAQRIVVDPGMGGGALVRRLYRDGVISHPLVMRVTMRLSGIDRHLRVGEFMVPAHASVHRVMDVLLHAPPLLRFATVPEGWSSAEVAAMVEQLPGLRGSLASVPPEGSLLPDTYAYSWGERRADLITRMQHAMEDFLASAWAQRDPGLPLGKPGEAVTLASIVELETARADERPMIAAVFLNRLKRGMRLQADPTVVYGASRRSGEVRSRPPTRAEISRSTPFNTYRIAGLPPTPIANPGRAAILAVLHPAKTDALYFVADGCGGHVFARTLAEHRRNVARWRKMRRAGRGGCVPTTAAGSATRP
ncbi:MAG: endolytic transglycosylase MltG [Alphaproteobacteria bacterium]|nr:MAG: endolytic transglycosylase MltG [Alphaproteobacteria bacterium]